MYGLSFIHIQSRPRTNGFIRGLNQNGPECPFTVCVAGKFVYLGRAVCAREEGGQGNHEPNLPSMAMPLSEWRFDEPQAASQGAATPCRSVHPPVKGAGIV